MRDEQRPEGTEPLLDPVLRAGQRVRCPESPAAEVALAKSRFRSDVEHLPPALRAIRHPAKLVPRSSAQLVSLTSELQQRLHGHSVSAELSRLAPQWGITQ
ncbi:MAG: hypothetical protein ACRDRV_11570 [Pseudonocardiaceae bacterium]